MLHRHLPQSACQPSGDRSVGGASVTNPSASPQAVLDESALARLRELDPTGENRLMQRVLQAFESSVARLVPQLLHARGAGDHAGIRHVAHTLKSSSASIGATKLSQICSDIETSIRVNKVDNLGPCIDAMCCEIEFVLKALKQSLNPTP